MGRNQRGETDRDAERTTAATRRGREKALIRSRCFSIKHGFQYKRGASLSDGQRGAVVSEGDLFTADVSGCGHMVES